MLKNDLLDIALSVFEQVPQTRNLPPQQRVSFSNHESNRALGAKEHGHG